LSVILQAELGQESSIPIANGSARYFMPIGAPGNTMRKFAETEESETILETFLVDDDEETKLEDESSLVITELKVKIEELEQDKLDVVMES